MNVIKITKTEKNACNEERLVVSQISFGDIISSCNTGIHSVVINATDTSGIASGIRYSIDGVNFQTINTFSNLLANTSYVATIKSSDVSLSCILTKSFSTLVNCQNCYSINKISDPTCLSGQCNKIQVSLSTPLLLPCTFVCNYTYTNSSNVIVSGSFTVTMPAGSTMLDYYINDSSINNFVVVSSSATNGIQKCI